ncbi:MAG: M23 family metallopeptidase [Propionicimonas sp.]|nr:M23 family metallopeptidase [Propionicimonas sp.]
MATGIDVAFPFTGRWLVQNSPANHVPSHGTTLFATAYAIDFVPVDDAGHTAPFTARSLLLPEPADAFPGHGRPVLSPVTGTVLTAHHESADHPAYRGLPSVGYALMQRRRVAAGWTALAGNHVLIGNGQAVIALCHLQQGSITVRPGQRVRIGETLGRCGNTGNSTEPHLHIQAIDSPDIARAHAVPLTFQGSLPRNGDLITV